MVKKVALLTAGGTSSEAAGAAARSTLSGLPTATGQTPQLGQQALRPVRCVVAVDGD